MSDIPPETRRANRRVLLCLILFALALSLTVFFWMRSRIRANGGVVDPSYSMMQLESPRYSVLDRARPPRLA